MKISKKLLEDQKVLIFEDLVLKYISHVVEELEGGIWVFDDGSRVSIGLDVFIEEEL